MIACMLLMFCLLVCCSPYFLRLLPSNPGDPATMVAQALGIFGSISKQQQSSSAAPAAAPASGFTSARNSRLSDVEEEDETREEAMNEDEALRIEAERRVDEEEKRQR